MFTFIITVFIILYLFKINSRITSLENKFKNPNPIPVSSPATPSAGTPIPQAEVQTQVQTPIPAVVSHQDNFATNLAKFGIAILVLGVLFFLNYLDKQGLIGPVFKHQAV